MTPQMVATMALELHEEQHEQERDIDQRSSHINDHRVITRSWHQRQ